MGGTCLPIFREGTPPSICENFRWDTLVLLPINVCHVDIIYPIYLNYKYLFCPFILTE